VGLIREEKDEREKRGEPIVAEGVESEGKKNHGDRKMITQGMSQAEQRRRDMRSGRSS